MSNRSSRSASRKTKYQRANQKSSVVKASVRWPLGVMLLAASATSFAQPVEQQMGEVVVSASGFEQDVKEAPASISVITREELESKRISNIADALRGVEGVDVDAAPGKTGGLNISMRGMSSQYTLILVDGVRMNPAGGVTPNGFGETSTSFMPPPAAIERIEVIRGPMSTLYGSEALGGIVNIITRKVSDSWTGSVTAESTFQGDSQFGDNRAGSIYLSGPIVKDLLGLQIRARRYDRDASNIQWPGKTPTSLVTGNEPVEATIDNVGARLTLTPTRDHDFWLDIEQGRQTYDNSRGQIGTLDRPSATPPTYGGYLPEQRFNRDKVVLAHNWRLGSGVIETRLSHIETETIGRTIPANTPGKVPGTPRVLESESTIFDSKWTTSFDNHMLTLGGQWWEAKMNEGIAPAPLDFRQVAAFAENEWRFREDMALTIGVRHDDHSNFGGQTSPRIYLVWNANDNWTLKGGISKGYRTPGLEQLHDGIYGFGGQGTNPNYGNPNLKPERSTTSEFGMYFDSGNGLSANATVFRTTFKDAIGSLSNYTPPGGGTTGSLAINVDEAVLNGLELGTTVDLSQTLRLKGAYTYIDSEQKTGTTVGDPLNSTPKHTVSALLNWQATDNLGVWTRAEYFDSRFRSRDSRQANAKALLGDYPSYSLLHVGGSYKVNKAWTINAAVYNLLDKDFVDYHPVTNANGTAGFTNSFHTTGEPRRLWLSANYTF